MISSTESAIAVLLDAILGEPNFAHPLIIFGKAAKQVEKLFYGSEPQCLSLRKWSMRLRGFISVLILTIPPVVFVFWLQRQKDYYSITQILALYMAIGMRSLDDHAASVTAALSDDDISAARKRVARIVSRDTTSMDKTDVCRATIESVLENGSDAVLAPLFWFFIMGAPGAVLYRLINTLDAMWGYKTPRYLHFGYAAARLDDILNWVPARLTALTYTVLGDSQTAWRSWRDQAKFWYSPNAGPVMSAGAGALNLCLGGPSFYNGLLKERPILGAGKIPETDDISRSVTLVKKCLLVWLLVSFIL